MMNYDSNTVFERWMQNAYELERDGKYAVAIEKYVDAYELANSFEDSAKNRAKDGIMRCRNKQKNLEEGLTY